MSPGAAIFCHKALDGFVYYGLITVVALSQGSGVFVVGLIVFLEKEEECYEESEESEAGCIYVGRTFSGYYHHRNSYRVVVAGSASGT